MQSIPIIPYHNFYYRHIQSFVRRQRALTFNEQHLYQLLWKKYGINSYSEILNSFNFKKALIVEIGFGMGDALFTNALKYSEYNYLGVEVHRPGIFNLMKLLENNPQLKMIDNVKIIEGDVLEILPFIKNYNLTKIQIFFPDPWPKKRHHKRRLLRETTLNLFIEKLMLNGELHIVTDITHYAEQMLHLLNSHSQLYNLSPTNTYCMRPIDRTCTRFEQKAIAAKRTIYDLCFKHINKNNNDSKELS